ncbi:hypothetical protein EDD15DRAFT_2476560 [Pisolithus albus]|nr:hypothetical protein EDD15DRAFT_2476560 [Pisolithus albus]
MALKVGLLLSRLVGTDSLIGLKRSRGSHRVLPFRSGSPVRSLPALHDTAACVLSSTQPTGVPETSGARPFWLFRVSGSQLECWESPPGNSWSRKSVVSALEMNAFDHLGRTVLHLVCSSTDVSNTECARMLLLHPNVNVNMPDKENHWTASHRALYCGNIEAAIPLLKHSDIDTSIKDFEGCTAFDLYNSTIPTTKPLSYDERIPADLFTWGTNRNAALGLGDANYRIFPGPVVLPMKDMPRAGGSSLEDRFRTVRVCDIKMSKLHTGYQKTATPVQVFPRQVYAITEPVYGMAMSETATACLFISGEVVCIWHGGMSRVNFPAHSFPSEISMYRPPQAIRGTAITKIISCEDSFVALSSNGEVFTFSAPTASELDGLGLSGRREKLIKPQQVWALRHQVGSVRVHRLSVLSIPSPCTDRLVIVQDVDIGGDDTLIVCMRSGHIYVRSQSLKSTATSGSNRSFKFQRVPRIQRVVVVCANSTGSFGALRVKFKPSPIQVTGRSFEADMTAIMPFVPEVSANDETDDAEVLDDIGSLEMLMDMLRRPEGVLFDKASALLNVADSRLSTHDGSQTAFDADPSPLSLPLWGRRVGLVLAEQCKAVGILPMQIKCELVTLAGLLELPQLAQALQSVVKCPPALTACVHYRELFDHVQSATDPSEPDIRTDPPAPDLALHLRDEVVYTHSVVLRARCPFFSAFFGDKDWTSHRRNQFGVVDVRMNHFKWEAPSPISTGIGFDSASDFLESADDIVEFMFRMLAAANKLLLDPLVLACSQIILGLLNPYNACYLLTDAIHYNAVDLVDGIENYMAVNLEMFLESRIVDDLGALEDIPEPVVSNLKFSLIQKDPPGTSKTRSRPILCPPSPSPSLNPPLSSKLESRDTVGDDLFITGDMDVAPTLDLNVAQPGLPTSPVNQYAMLTPRPAWKRKPSTPRVDLKSIVAEAETEKIAPPPSSSGLPKTTETARKTSKQFATHAPTMLTSSSGQQTEASSLTAVFKTCTDYACQTDECESSISIRSEDHSNKATASFMWVTKTRKSTGRLDPVSCTILRGARRTDAVPSFAEIQLLQQTQGSSATKDKRSFLDIQKEERTRQQEEDFLRWWATEEERVKQELAEQERLLSQAAVANTSPAGSRARGKKRDRKMQPTERLFSTPEAEGESCTSSASSRVSKTRRRRPCKEFMSVEAQSTLFPASSFLYYCY